MISFSGDLSSGEGFLVWIRKHSGPVWTRWTRQIPRLTGINVGPTARIQSLYCRSPQHDNTITETQLYAYMSVMTAELPDPVVEENHRFNTSTTSADQRTRSSAISNHFIKITKIIFPISGLMLSPKTLLSFPSRYLLKLFYMFLFICHPIITFSLYRNKTHV